MSQIKRLVLIEIQNYLLVLKLHICLCDITSKNKKRKTFSCILVISINDVLVTELNNQNLSVRNHIFIYTKNRVFPEILTGFVSWLSLSTSYKIIPTDITGKETRKA